VIVGVLPVFERSLDGYTIGRVSAAADNITDVKHVVVTRPHVDDVAIAKSSLKEGYVVDLKTTVVKPACP
jgi:hypothetical protein